MCNAVIIQFVVDFDVNFFQSVDACSIHSRLKRYKLRKHRLTLARVRLQSKFMMDRYVFFMARSV